MPRPAPSAATSLYVHVPFCAVKCGYCDFNSYVVEDLAAHDRYLAALASELRCTGLPAAPCSVFIGGGTPSLLEPPRLRRLFDVLQAVVDLRACPEVTMEANPESVSQQKVEIALAAGVGRISMGAQSFDDARLRFLDRVHTAARVGAAVAEARRAGCVNLSLDLIFGLPGQAVADWQQELTRALDLGPDHLSCYNLTFEPGTRLHRELVQGRVAANDEERDRELFLCTRERLAAAGFDAYEISNFAGRGGPCRHNDHYWLQGDYVGVGPGANSHRAGVRIANLKPLDAWAASALAGVSPAASAETLTPRQRAGEAVWLGLRRRDGVDLAAVEARIEHPVRDLFAPLVASQQQSGWVERTGDQVRMTAAGLLLADTLGSAYLAADAGR